MNATSGVALFIDPPSHHFTRDRLFDSAVVPTGGDDLMAPWRRMREYLVQRGVAVHTADLMEDADRSGLRTLYVSAGGTRAYRRWVQRADVALSAFIAMECPAVEPRLYRALPEVQRHFRRVFSWTDTDTLREFTGTPVRTEPFSWPQSYDRVHPGIWERGDRQFLVMINSNKLPRLYAHELYTRRLAAVAFFHGFGEIDLYGPNWDRMPHRVGRTWIPYTARRMYRALWEARQRRWPDPIYLAASRASKGIAKSKAETLSRYRFALCFENQVLPGWITEKIFDCLFAGTVPVYWGAPDVLDRIPGECFIDMRRFGGFAELREFLHALTPAEVARYREAGRAFVEGERFAPFHTQAFTDLFRRIVAADGGVEV